MYQFCRKWSFEIRIADYKIDTKSDDVNEKQRLFVKKKWACRRHAFLEKFGHDVFAIGFANC